MPFDRILLAVAFGWLSGMRSLAGPTAASYRLRDHRRWRWRRGRLSSLLGRPGAPVLLSALAIGEAAFDKWDGAPDRTGAASLAFRAGLGAVVGAAAADALRPLGRSGSPWLGAVLGASAAVASSYTSLWLRRRTARATGISEQRLGYAEDALTLGLGTALARA